MAVSAGRGFILLLRASIMALTFSGGNLRSCSSNSLSGLTLVAAGAWVTGSRAGIDDITTGFTVGAVVATTGADIADVTDAGVTA